MTGRVRTRTAPPAGAHPFLFIHHISLELGTSSKHEQDSKYVVLCEAWLRQVGWETHTRPGAQTTRSRYHLAHADGNKAGKRAISAGLPK